MNYKNATLLGAFLLILAAWVHADDRYAIVVNNKIGYIDGKGKVVIAPRFDEGREFDPWGAWVKIGRLWGRIDEVGNVTIPAVYDSYENFDLSETAVVARNGQYGVIDRFGKVRLDFQFDELEAYRNVRYMAALAGGRWTFIDHAGRRVIDASFEAEEVEFNPDGWSGRPWLEYEINGKRGFFDRQTGVLVAAQFDDIQLDGTKGRLGAKLNGLWGVIDVRGNTVVDFAYDDIWLGSEGTFFVKKDGKSATLDSAGRAQAPGWVENRYLSFDSDFWLDRSNEQSVILLDRQLKPVDSTRYGTYSSWYSVPSRLFLQLNGRWGAVNFQRQTVIPFVYEGLWDARNGMASFQQNGKWGLLDRDGKLVMAARYDSSISFFSGVARVYLGTKVGLIDETGKEVVPTIYDRVQEFDAASEWDLRRRTSGLALVQQGDSWGYVNRQGVEVWKPSR